MSKFYLKKDTEINIDDIKTLRGYSIEDLEMAITILRTNDITPEDLIEIRTNLSRAVELIQDEQGRMMQHSINDLMKDWRIKNEK